MNQLTMAPTAVTNPPRDGFSSDPTASRPSSLRRFYRLRALIDEFSARDMDTMAVAAFLACSHTSARKYVNDLREASVICARRSPRSAGCDIHNGYRLNPDPCIARNFLAGLREQRTPNAVLKRSGSRVNALRKLGTRHFHIMADDCCAGVRATQVVIRRDPLVAALFGEKLSLGAPPAGEPNAPFSVASVLR